MHSWKIASFDLDGTLVRNISTGEHLAEKIGHLSVMRNLEALYATGKITNAEVAAEDAQYYKGYSATDISKFLDDIPVIGEIERTVRFLKSCGIPSIISTLAWDVVAEVIAKRYGFVAWSGPSLTLDAQNRFTGKVEKDFLEEDKVSFVEGVCSQHGVNLSQVFHVGDSRSDFPLFEIVGFSIALNGNSQAKARTDVSLDGESLFDVLSLIPGLMLRL